MTEINKEQLQKLIKSCVNYTELSEELGVSSETAKKIIMKFEIPLPYNKRKSPEARILFQGRIKNKTRPKKELYFN